MLFNSPEFAVFFVLVFCFYITLTHRWQNRMLLAASCLFYSAWNYKFLAIMFISISTDFFCSRYIDRSNDLIVQRRWLSLSIFVNLAILGFFKYCNFFIDNLSGLFQHLNVPVQTSHLEIILPLGISFYTFEAISYVVDVYRKVTKPAKSFLDYALFITYFPHLIAGPIMRAKDFLPQIESPRVIRWKDLRDGAYLFFWGLFQKSFIADNLAKLVDPVFAKGANPDGTEVLIAVYAFAFQIYCDFCGYSNMTRGIAKVMGFEITNNFHLPYFSSNPQEFWRRWHISLSQWMRDYLYIPLGGTQNNLWFTCRNLLITMLIAGFWHGAAWTFVLWGLYHGVLLIVYRLGKFSKGSSLAANSKNNLATMLKTLVFFQLICLGWLLFRAQSLEQVANLLHAVFFDLHFDWGQIAGGIKQLLFYTWLLLLIEFFQNKKNDLLIVLKWPRYIQLAIFLIMLYSLASWSDPGQEEFIYFVF